MRWLLAALLVAIALSQPERTYPSAIINGHELAKILSALRFGRVGLKSADTTPTPPTSPQSVSTELSDIEETKNDSQPDKKTTTTKVGSDTPSSEPTLTRDRQGKNQTFSKGQLKPSNETSTAAAPASGPIAASTVKIGTPIVIEPIAGLGKGISPAAVIKALEALNLGKPVTILGQVKNLGSTPVTAPTATTTTSSTVSIPPTGAAPNAPAGNFVVTEPPKKPKKDGADSHNLNQDREYEGVVQG